MTLFSQSIVGTRISDGARHAIAAKAAADRQDKTWPTAAPRTSAAERFVTATLFAWPNDVTPEREEAMGALWKAQAWQEGHHKALPITVTPNSTESAAESQERVLDYVRENGPTTENGVAEGLRMSQSRAQHYMRQLRERGKIRAAGMEGRSRTWEFGAPAQIKIVDNRRRVERSEVISAVKDLGVCTTSEVVKATGAGKKAVWGCLTSLLTDGIITRSRKSTNSAWEWRIVA